MPIWEKELRGRTEGGREGGVISMGEEGSEKSSRDSGGARERERERERLPDKP